MGIAQIVMIKAQTRNHATDGISHLPVAENLLHCPTHLLVIIHPAHRRTELPIYVHPYASLSDLCCYPHL